MSYQNKDLIRKLYLLRINMIMYHTFYGMMCMNFQYCFDENIENFEVEDLKIKVNPIILKEKSIPELEVMMVDKVCKYLNELKVYDIDYDVNDIGKVDNDELDEIEKEYEESVYNNDYDGNKNIDVIEKNVANADNENSYGSDEEQYNIDRNEINGNNDENKQEENLENEYESEENGKKDDNREKLNNNNNNVSSDNQCSNTKQDQNNDTKSCKAIKMDSKGFGIQPKGGVLMVPGNSNPLMQGAPQKSGSGDIAKNSNTYSEKTINSFANKNNVYSSQNVNSKNIRASRRSYNKNDSSNKRIIDELKENNKNNLRSGNEGIKKLKTKLHERRKLRKFLQRKVYNVVKILKESNQCGNVPLGVDAFVEKVDKKEVNWKEALRDFIQFDVNDYSFTPPDRRYDDSPFFLPDYNDEIEKVENILFMIDSSGSMSDKIVSTVFNEIKNCIDEFNGKVKGYVGTFDTNVYNVVEFEDEDKLDEYNIMGRGGTSFINVFKYINENMKDVDLKAVIILTDGYAPYPSEVHTKGIPLLWIITNEESNPTCGKVVRICDKNLNHFKIK